MKIHNKLNQFLSFSNNQIISAVAVFALVMFGACSSDKDYNTYRQQQANQLQAQYAAANGTYKGNVVSKLDGRSLGYMEMNVTASSEIQNSSDQLGTEKKAVMKGYLKYTGLVNSNSTFTQGNYNPDTKEFKVSIAVPDESNPMLSQNIAIEGKIDGGAFVGDIYMNLYPEFGAHANLVSNSNVQQTSADLKALRVSQLAGDNSAYQGQYTLNGNTYTLNMKITSSAVNVQQQFLRVLNPQRYVSVTIDLGFGSAPILFPMSVINDQVDSLTGNASINDGSTSYSVSLKCNKTKNNTPQGWNCIISQGRIVNNITLLPVSPFLVNIQ